MKRGDASHFPESKDEARQKPGRVRLDYLDGIRALCALFVLIAHTSDGRLFDHAPEQIPGLMLLAFPIFPYARYAVTIFIVLSGYCLMLPVATSVDGQLSGGIRGYFARRARRMLPPYYAALVISLLIITTLRFLVPSVKSLTDFTNAFSPGVLLSHLFMVHHLNPYWMFQIDPPMWSVATEWSIYFLFAFLLLPVWRRWGIVPAILVGFVIGLTPHFIFHKWLDPVAPWYLGVFAIGMAGALLSFSREERFERWRRQVPWGICAMSLLVVLTIAFARKPAYLPSYPLYITEPVVGMMTVCFLVYCTRFLTDSTTKKKPISLLFLECKPLVQIGFYSYSIYLLHMPFLDVVLSILNAVPLSPTGRLAVLWSGGLITIVAFSYLFHRIFERPFMSHYAQPPRQTSTGAKE